MWHTETLDSCFDLIRSYQQRIPGSPPLEIEPVTIECRAKTLPLSYSPHHTQVMPNQLVMVIAWPINLNVSCKLHLYSLQRTQSPPGPCLPRRIGDIYPHNYHNLKVKDIDVHFSFIFFLSRGIILWIKLPWPGNPVKKKEKCNIVVCKFERQSHYYVNFQINTLDKGMNPLAMG